MSKNVKTLHAEILAEINDEYQKTEGFPTWDITGAVAVALAGLSEDIDLAAMRFDVDKLVGDELTKFIYQHKGISRNAAVRATGEVAVTTTGAVTIAAGTLFATASGILFEAIADTAINGTSGTVAIQAVSGGAVGNVPAAAVNVIPVTVAGLVAVTNAAAISGGYEAESDEDLRERYYLTLQKPITAGNKYQYQEWALAVAGVGSAKVFPLPDNVANTVEVCITGNDGHSPDDTLVAAVQDYIDPDSSGKGEGMAPIGAYCTVTGATEMAINVAATISTYSEYEDSVIAADIEAAIAKYLTDNAFGLSYVSIAKIGNIIMNVDGVEDYTALTVNSGTANVAVGARQVAVCGTVAMASA